MGQIRNKLCLHYHHGVYSDSLDNQDQLIEAISLFGRGRRQMRIVDNPSPVEQTLEYKLVGIDEDGIQSVLEERPRVL